MFDFRRSLVGPCMLVGLFAATELRADIRLPAVFSDHVVLQRDRPIPVWGHALPREEVVVVLHDAGGTVLRTARGLSGDDGAFRATLDPMPASNAPLVLDVRGAASPPIEVNDVLVGEVWLCGGQSNMEMPLAQCADAQAEIAAATSSRIRLIKAPHRLADRPQASIDAQWAVCSPATAGGFSGVGYFFAWQLERELDVPVGLISANWGGTHIQPWIPLSALAAHPRFASEATLVARDRARFASCVGHELGVYYWEGGEAYGALVDAYWSWYAKRDDAWTANAWQPTAAIDGWATTTMPATLGAAPGTESLRDFDGMVWLRRRIDVPSAWVGHDLEVRLGMIDDSDTTWWNGAFIGRVTGQPGAQRVYVVPKEQVHAGANEIVVALVDDAGGGGLTAPSEALSVRPRDLPDQQPISLAGEWRWRGGARRGADAPNAPPPPHAPENPALTFRSWGSMYDGMIAPFVPFAMRGAIWYQGESNEDDPDAYRDLLPLLIRSWRAAWNEGDFPFGIVQLANYRGASDDPVQGGWAFVRDAQLATLRSTPSTGLAVTIDVGDAGDIHPRDKKSVGERLARWALSESYGRDGEWSGPLYRAAYRRGEEFVLVFDHVGGGLRTRDGAPLGGFALAGADGRFVWAEAKIEGDRVVLSSPSVSEPTAARYAWSDNPSRANLMNAEGLPASPFRTDGP
ncbi:MAG: sialate O-acetylesterase [Phycisphaerales bacterium]